LPCRESTMNLTQTALGHRIYYQKRRADASGSGELDYIYCTAYNKGKLEGYTDDKKFQWEDA